MLKIIDQFVANMGGRPKENRFYTDPGMDHGQWVLTTTDGEVTISGYSPKPDKVWPDYPCSGDSYKNKFSVVLARKKPDGLFSYEGSGLVDITPENLQLHLGRFQGAVVKGDST